MLQADCEAKGDVDPQKLADMQKEVWLLYTELSDVLNSVWLLCLYLSTFTATSPCLTLHLQSSALATPFGLFCWYSVIAVMLSDCSNTLIAVRHAIRAQ